MAASMISSAAVTTVNRASPAQASLVAPFTGLKSSAAFPCTKKTNNDITSLASNGYKVNCMQVTHLTTYIYIPYQNIIELHVMLHIFVSYKVNYLNSHNTLVKF